MPQPCSGSWPIGNAWPMPFTRQLSTTTSPLLSCSDRVWPLTVSTVSGAVSMPCTSVHCSSSLMAASEWTMKSCVPCATNTRGYGPVNSGNASRTRSPHCAGVFLRSCCG